ncbi:MAG: hypothetical protein ACJ8AT_09970 [Hyalangium sp.]|uniref:hypothetical protein n=1 Tax=Hyalangium sp. TaxID=2028555 RepID=UPI00389A1E9A
MPRIPQAQIEERNTFLLELIRNQPDISRQEAQERFEEKFDATLNPKTFQQLREQVEQDRPAPAAAEEPSQEDNDSKPSNGASEATAGNGAASQPAKAKVKAKGAKNLFVEAPKEQLVFLEQIVQQLQAAGASNVRIDHSTDRWMVLVVDAK